MSALTEYNPLKAIQVPGAAIPDPEGLIVVIGPNSSGKTLFLRDIENYLTGAKNEPIVCESITAKKPENLQALIDDLKNLRYLRVTNEQHGQCQVDVPFLRVKTQRTQFSLQQLDQAYQQFSPDANGKNEGFFRPIGLALLAALSLHERREVCDEAPNFQDESHSPDRPIQGLKLNCYAQEELERETGTVFGNAVWLDISAPNILKLRLAGSLQRPPRAKTDNPREARRFRSIEDEGDGFKSYVGICLSLLQGVRPVSLIDEPELCLHPPQALHIGRFIGRNVVDTHATFVATHSSHVLRGILQTGRKITVLRLTQRKTGFHGHVVSSEELKTVLKNPRSKAEAILDGAFSKGVVVVEGDGDREVYLAASEGVPQYPAREVHIVPVGGNGFAEPCRFYRSLEVPVAVVADLDTVCETGKMIATLQALEPDETKVAAIVPKLQEVVQRVKAIRADFNEEQAKEQLKQLYERPLNWNAGDDNLLRSQLNALSNRIYRLRKLKDGGIEAYKDRPEIHELLRSLVDECSRCGLFLAHVGELEDWVPELMRDYPKSETLSKTDRATIAAEKIRAAEPKQGGIWDFMKSVLDYLWAKT
jgi:hypothetical protein